jgi:hypothetical protein
MLVQGCPLRLRKDSRCRATGPPIHQERRYHGWAGMGAHGGGGGGASGAQRAQRTLDFGACARAGGLDGHGSIRWRRGTKAALAKEAQAAAEKLGDLQIERAALQKQQAEFEAWTAAERRRSAKRIVGSMPAGRVQCRTPQVHATKVEALRSDREQLERSRSTHESKLAELERTHPTLAQAPPDEGELRRGRSRLFGVTVGIGEAACVWLAYRRRGLTAPDKEVRRAFADGFAAGLRHAKTSPTGRRPDDG